MASTDAIANVKGEGATYTAMLNLIYDLFPTARSRRHRCGLAPPLFSAIPGTFARAIDSLSSREPGEATR